MLRRHWLTFLVAGALVYFGVAAAPVFADMNEPLIAATR